jgi:hypothetical protein
MMRAILVACLLCLSVAAFAGQPDAYSAGMAAYQAHDYPVALADFRLAAKQGDAKAEFGLGLMYYNGEGVPQDSVKAARWYRLAARQGYAEAEFYLGLLYVRGEGVPYNNVMAVKWYTLAARQGDTAAQNNLVFMYRTGHGVPPSRAWAKHEIETNLPAGFHALSANEQAWIIGKISSTQRFRTRLEKLKVAMEKQAFSAIKRKQYSELAKVNYGTGQAKHDSSRATYYLIRPDPQPVVA